MTATAIKKAVKEALDEALRERRVEMEQLITEVMEDMALARAIEKGRKSKVVSRDSVMRVLKGQK